MIQHDRQKIVSKKRTSEDAAHRLGEEGKEGGRSGTEEVVPSETSPSKVT